MSTIITFDCIYEIYQYLPYIYKIASNMTCKFYRKELKLPLFTPLEKKNKKNL